MQISIWSPINQKDFWLPDVFYTCKELRLFRDHRKCIDSVTQCISVWYGNSSNQDCKALQRVVRLAERISGSALPSLQDIYLKRCKSRAVKIIKDSNHPGNRLFMYILCVRIPYNCTVHGADLTNISLLVILCIIVYVTNKILNLEIRSTLLKGCS